MVSVQKSKGEIPDDVLSFIEMNEFSLLTIPDSEDLC